MITPESLVLPPPETKSRVKQLQLELGLSDNDILGWEKEYDWDKGKLLKAIRQEGSGILWRRWLVKSFGQAQPHYSKSSFPLVPLDGGLLLLLGAILLLVAGCTDPSNGTGQFFGGPPYVPPNPSTNGGCCVKGTLVATARGLRPIEQIQVGQRVCTFDVMSEDIVVRKVVKTFTAQAEEILLLDFGVEEIRCTPLHQFYMGQWVQAKDLSRGDRVLGLLDDRWRELKEIRRETKLQSVFNLHVDGTHNYLVGPSGVATEKEM